MSDHPETPQSDAVSQNAGQSLSENMSNFTDDDKDETRPRVTAVKKSDTSTLATEQTTSPASLDRKTLHKKIDKAAHGPATGSDSRKVKAATKRGSKSPAFLKADKTQEIMAGWQVPIPVEKREIEEETPTGAIPQLDFVSLPEAQTLVLATPAVEPSPQLDFPPTAKPQEGRSPSTELAKEEAYVELIDMPTTPLPAQIGLASGAPASKEQTTAAKPSREQLEALLPEMPTTPMPVPVKPEIPATPTQESGHTLDFKTAEGQRRARELIQQDFPSEAEKIDDADLRSIYQDSVQIRIVAWKTGQLKAVPLVGRSKSQQRIRDPWFRLTLAVACIASISALVYFFSKDQILLLGDTYSHMIIARRLFDSLTPGLAQIGGIWLPLPHLLMLPFIWNDYLWNTGLAGSFVGMPCFVISACYIFLTARKLTNNSPASFVGTLAFILNPNILYLQTTPLSELVLIVTLVMASYYFVLWASDDKLGTLIRAALCICLATLSRYDGWPVFIVMLGLIAVIGWLKHQKWSRIEANLILFALLGGLGIVLWCAWDWIIFRDPLYWQHSMFSSQAQQDNLPRQLAFLHTNVLIDYHNFVQSLLTYTYDSVDNLGGILFVLLIIAVIIFYVRKGINAERLAALVILIPFPFYVFSYFMGQAVTYLPQAAPAHATGGILYYNVRYGVEMIAPAAVFLATLAGLSWKFLAKRQQALRNTLRITLKVALTLVIVAQAFLITTSGIISLQEGQFGFDCSPVEPVVIYMVQHYNGGRILSDTFSSGTTTLGAEAGVPFRNMIYEGSGTLWLNALANPAANVDWVIANPQDPQDLVARSLNVQSPAFLAQFSLSLRESNGIELFHRINAPALASNPVPDAVLIAHQYCPTSL